MMKLFATEEDEQSKMIPQQRKEANPIHSVYKTVDSIHEELIKLWECNESEEDFASSEFVQRAMNDVTFMTKKSEILSPHF